MPGLLLSRIRNSTLGQKLKKQPQQEQNYAPPEGPPRAAVLPLKEVPFSRIQEGPAWNLSAQGWAELDFKEDEAGHVNDELLVALQGLVNAGKDFFALPREEKQRFHQTQGDGEEGGWTRVEGEKEIFTIRQDTEHHLPAELQPAALRAWFEASSYMNDLVGSVAKSLDLPPEALTQYSEPGLNLTGKRQATMMRLFRYECEGDKVVSEPHSDLGLLSLVYGEQPGLEVWDCFSQDFFPIELSFCGRKKASVLCGNEMARLTNARYVPGGHQVRSYAHQAAKSKYRYSLVFIQRAHWPVPVDTDKLTTSITGAFHEPMRDMKAHDLFKSIYEGKYSVNSSVEKRAKQRALLEARRSSSQQLQQKAPDEQALKGQTMNVAGSL